MAVAEHNKRVTSTMGPGDLENLDAIVRARRVRESEAVRGALRTERFLQESLDNGSTLWVKHPDGTLQEIVVLK